MLRLEYQSFSWWVAQAFTWGSVVWVVNGFAAFLPFCNSHFEKAPHSTGWTAFLGATIFEIGSVLGILEYWNRDDVRSSRRRGNGVEDEGEADIESGASERHLTAPIVPSPSSEANLEDEKSRTGRDRTTKRKDIVWFSKDTRYFRQLAWYGAFFQLLAASIFWISGFTAIPPIQSAIEENIPLIDGIFWAPQVIGGSGFIISASFLMLAAQDVWWKPKPFSIAWQVGVWNFLGGVGFMLSGAFGFSSSHWAEYQSALSTFWGGWAFLIGSVFQWYGSVNPNSE